MMHSGTRPVVHHRFVAGVGVAVAAAQLFVLPAPSASEGEPARLKWSYLYRLASSTGTIASSWVELAYDERAQELFAVNTGDDTVRVFGDNGMEVYGFGDDQALGNAMGAAPLDNGEIVVLSRKNGRPSILRCNFRGEPIAPLTLDGAPDAFLEGFVPDAIAAAGPKVYVADKSSLKVLVVGPDGAYDASYDLAARLGFDERKRRDNAIAGFSVDKSGNLLFTIPTLFAAFIVSPAGELRTFGARGSAPGKFNIVGGIAADAQGHLYVTDVLRSVVMVFDRAFEFLGEFGYRGAAPESLIAPLGIAVGNGKVFVSQSAGRGVSVFSVAVD